MSARLWKRHIGLLVSALMVAPPGVAAADDGMVVIDDGHVDIGPAFDEEEHWQLRLRDDTVSPPVWHALDEVVLGVTDRALNEVPDSNQYAFLGDAGDEVWMLPEAQQPGVLWPGWNTEAEGVSERAPDGATWHLHGHDGPGNFVLYASSGGDEPHVLFNSDNGMPQELGLEPYTHAHGTWAFTEPGVHLLDMEMTAELDDGSTVTDRDFLRFAVGDGTDAHEAADAQPQQRWLAAALAGAVIAIIGAGAVAWRHRTGPRDGTGTYG